MTLDLNPLAAESGIDLDTLKARYPALYKACVTQTGKTTGVVPVDLSRFKESSHKYLLSCAAPLPATEPQINVAQLDRDEQADIQRRADEAAGRNRLEQYAREQGLEDTEANADAIRAWLRDYVKGYISEKGVDTAIAILGPRGKNVLTWHKVEAAPALPPPQEPVAEVLGNLPNGEERLPLDTTPTKKHSAAQLKEWLARVNANRIIRPSNSFISSF